MHFLSVLLLGISTNLDNLFIGFSYGLRRKKVPFWANAVIGACSAAATWASCRISSLVSGFGKAPNLIGGAVIVLVGALSLLPSGSKDAARAGRMTFGEAAALGGSLAVNCVAVAFGAGLTGISPPAAAVSVGALSFAAVASGCAAGLRASKVRTRPETLAAVSGMLMIALGAAEMFF